MTNGSKVLIYLLFFLWIASCTAIFIAITNKSKQCWNHFAYNRPFLHFWGQEQSRIRIKSRPKTKKSTQFVFRPQDSRNFRKGLIGADFWEFYIELAKSSRCWCKESNYRCIQGHQCNWLLNQLLTNNLPKTATYPFWWSLKDFSGYFMSSFWRKSWPSKGHLKAFKGSRIFFHILHLKSWVAPNHLTTCRLRSLAKYTKIHFYKILSGHSLWTLPKKRYIPTEVSVQQGHHYPPKNWPG